MKGDPRGDLEELLSDGLQAPSAAGAARDEMPDGTDQGGSESAEQELDLVHREGLDRLGLDDGSAPAPTRFGAWAADIPLTADRYVGQMTLKAEVSPP